MRVFLFSDSPGLNFKNMGILLKEEIFSGGIEMMKPYQLFVSLFATVCSLLTLVIGIMLVSGSGLTLFQTACYDLLFVGQFLMFLWCAILYGRSAEEAY